MAAPRACPNPCRATGIHPLWACLGMCLTLCLAQLAALPLPRAQAYEDQAGLTLGLGYSSSPAGERPIHGALVDGALSIGLDDVFTVRMRADYGFHPGSDRNQHFYGVGLELLYLVDILEWVPYFGVGATAIGWFRAGDQLRPDVGGQLIGGLEYLFSRELIFGLDVRGLFPTRAPEGDRAHLLLLLTATHLWDL